MADDVGAWIIGIRAVSVAVALIWIVAYGRIDRRAVTGRREGKVVAAIFIGLAVATFLVSFLVQR